jgi:hypothetical protein
MLEEGESAGDYLLMNFEESSWRRALHDFQQVEDELPLHYYTHLMHGAQVLAYKHPDRDIRRCWLRFYEQCCEYLHVWPESEVFMDQRLDDFGRYARETSNLKITLGISET